MMVTEINLRPARPSDFFTKDLKLITNKIYFHFSKTENCFHGPFSLSAKRIEDKYYTDLYFDLMFKTDNDVYVLNSDPTKTEINLLVKLTNAEPSDLKVDAFTMRTNYNFFILENNQYLGPFTIMKNTNPNDMKKYLDNKVIFIIDSHFHQIEFNKLKKVS